MSEGEPSPTERLALELVSAEGAPLYTATCELRERPPGPGVAPLPSEGLAPAIRPLYGEPPLFHGQSFQMLRALDAHGPLGLTARTEGVAALGWSQSGPWHTDPGLVDAALQLALVFTHETLGGVSLPTGLDELSLHQTGAAPGTLRAILRSHLRSSRDRCVCDVAFVNEAGVLVCEAKGVETHVIANAETPSLAKPVLPPV
ncbi:MAG: polyketide synthase dehydratase domain-containing protein [Myxococcales bacterium]|nr:polyketide synthase dehydratase domain-containing protein [Myxococcales bacterium]